MWMRNKALFFVFFPRTASVKLKLAFFGSFIIDKLYLTVLAINPVYSK